MLQGKGGDRFIQQPAADMVVIPVGEELAHRRLVVRGDPAEPQPCQGKDLGHASDGDALLIQVRDGFAPGVFLGQMPVHLVAENIGVHAPGDRDDLLQNLSAHQGAGWVVRVVDADQFGARDGEPPQFVQIRQVPVLFPQMQDLHVCPVGFGDRIELLVRRHHTDDPVTGLGKGVEHMMVGACCTVCGDHFFRT